MGTNFSTSVDAALNQRREEAYEDSVFRGSPALGLFEKGDSDKMGGNAIKVTVKTGYSPGVGGTFATAFTNSGETLRDTFLVTPNQLYATEKVDNVGSLYSAGGDDAIVNTMADADKSCMASAAMQMEAALFGDGYGTLFTIASNSGGGPYVLTATVPSDLFKISRGQVLVSKATPAAAALGTGTAVVTAVSPIAGTVTVAAVGGWTPTNGHVMGLNGTMLAQTTISTFAGLKAWLTNDATALAATFFGNTARASDPVSLAGHVIDCTGGTNIIDAINRVLQSVTHYAGARSDLLFVAPSTYEKLQTLLDSRARIIQSKGQSIDVLYDGFSFMGSHGKKLTCHVASACSPADIFVLDSSTWHIPSPKNRIVQPGNPNGNPYSDLSAIGLDSTLVKYLGTGFFYTHAPGFNGRAIITP